MKPAAPGRSGLAVLFQEWALAIAALCLAGCDVLGAAPDSVRSRGAIAIRSHNGALIARIDIGRGPTDVLLDVASPMTATHASNPAINENALTLLSGASDIPSFRVDHVAYELPVCPTGCASPSGLPLTGYLGAASFADAHASLRIAGDRSSITVLDDIAGSSWERTQLCEAVFPEPFRGGGSLVVGSELVPFDALRPVVSACVKADAAAPDGVEALFVLTSGLEMTVMSQAAWNRLDARLGLPDLAETRTVRYGGLALTGEVGTMPTFLLAAQWSQARAACQELALYDDLISGDIPACDDASCIAPALTEISRTTNILVLDGPDPLQSWRTELRSDSGEIDGLLALSDLPGVAIDFDYPNDRMLMRCEGPDCQIRPAIEQTPRSVALDNARTCLGR